MKIFLAHNTETGEYAFPAEDAYEVRNLLNEAAAQNVRVQFDEWECVVIDVDTTIKETLDWQCNAYFRYGTDLQECENRAAWPSGYCDEHGGR